MALVTISGFPCSGKSYAAHQLRDDLEVRLGEPSYKGPRYKVIVVDDQSCHVPRSTYDGGSRLVLVAAFLFQSFLKRLLPAVRWLQGDVTLTRRSMSD